MFDHKSLITVGHVECDSDQKQKQVLSQYNNRKS